MNLGFGMVPWMLCRGRSPGVVHGAIREGLVHALGRCDGCVIGCAVPDVVRLEVLESLGHGTTIHVGLPPWDTQYVKRAVYHVGGQF